MPTATPATRRRRKPLAITALALATIGLGAGQLSLALFTDVETVDGTFTVGTIDLDGAEIDALSLTTSAMMPGDSTTDDVVVSNVGTAQLRYAVTTASTNADGKALRDVLTLTIKTVDATTPGVPCDNFDGTTLVSATALGASAASLGDPAAGDDSGDRTLDAGSSETLCFRVSLPSGTTSTYAGATTTTTFTFSAEQTANNP